MKLKVFSAALMALCLLGFTYKEELHTMGLRFVAPSVSDRNSVHNPEEGEIVYDAGVPGFYGRDNNTWVPLSAGQSIIPAGVILPFAGVTPPAGFLLADGSAVSRTEYATLFEAVGTAFGIGDGATTFNLPDLRGRFMRGVDGSAGRDTDKATRTATNSGNSGNNVGSVQDDALKSHTHAVNTSTGASGSGVANGGTNNGSYSISNAATATGGTETRPKNINMNFIIKY